MPKNDLYNDTTGMGVDLITMAKAIHSSMRNGEVKFGRARPAGTGICIACKADELYGSYIYFDYFQEKVTGIKCNKGTWSVV